jgi:SAM-dependent methyltransferase
MDFIPDEIRYLHAKRSVDDRALDGRVLQSLAAAVQALPPAPRILELGAGVGTMVSRLSDRGIVTAGRYTLVDGDGASLSAAREHLARWAGAAAGSQDQRLDLRAAGKDLQIDFAAADVFDYLATTAAEPAFDLVVANAFLDLVDVPALLPLLWRRLEAGRPFWFSINFDGETIFLPELPADDTVLAHYHATMDRRVRNGRRAGESRTGRHLLTTLPASGARVVDAGSSDWVVWPGTDGRYPEDEGYFLHHIIATINTALAGMMDADELRAWVSARHAQIDRGELVYIAHQLDVTGVSPR